ncbi:hypothetical protein [Streptomyces sp. NPDC054783]
MASITACNWACNWRACSTYRILINLILRVLPFWLREPLLIGVSLLFAGLGLHWFAVAGGWQRAVVGLAFLALAVSRAFILRRTWRSRPRAGPAA